MTKARIQFAAGAQPPQSPKGRNYWEQVQHMYPHQIEVPYFSKHDMDPRNVTRTITKHFTRVPFDGVTHYGFLRAEHLAAYKKAVGLP